MQKSSFFDTRRKPLQNAFLEVQGADLYAPGRILSHFRISGGPKNEPLEHLFRPRGRQRAGPPNYRDALGAISARFATQGCIFIDLGSFLARPGCNLRAIVPPERSKAQFWPNFETFLWILDLCRSILIPKITFPSHIFRHATYFDATDPQKTNARNTQPSHTAHAT